MSKSNLKFTEDNVYTVIETTKDHNTYTVIETTKDHEYPYHYVGAISRDSNGILRLEISGCFVFLSIGDLKAITKYMENL
jgi:hypothetical protein